MTDLSEYARSFWSNVQKTDGCWNWLGGKSEGYGRFCINSKTRSAHRISYEMSFGSIPKGLCVCHRCDNRACVNPKHLFAGTVADNNHDMIAKGRDARGEKNGASKLTAEQVLAIRADRRSQRRIAADYGVCQRSITVIKRGERWTHI